MTIDPSGPHFHAGLRVDRVDVGFDVAEICEVAMRAAALADADRRPHASVGAERPVDTAARRVERVDETGVGADEYTTAGDGRLSVRRVAVRKSEGPLERELRRVRGGQAGPWLIPRVAGVVAPAVPALGGRRIERPTRITLVAHLRRLAGFV